MIAHGGLMRIEDLLRDIRRHHSLAFWSLLRLNRAITGVGSKSLAPHFGTRWTI
jgi:hypothetical protein